MPPGHAGAVVEAIVAKHRKAYAEQTSPSRIPSPVCTAPECRDNAPAPYEAPLVRTKIKLRTDATLGIVKELRERQVGAFVRDPVGAIYFFEIAPPPTPPPNCSLLSPTI